MAVDHVARAMAMDAAGGVAPADTYTKSETDALLEQKADKSEVTESVTAAVAQIVADAPEDFDTLKEMSDWIASHEDSAAAMNTAILQNAADIEAVETQQTEQAAVISAAAEGVALNRSTLGYQSKNLLKNTATTKTVNGVTYTVNADGSITANGTATANARITVSNINLIIGKSYTLTGCPTGGSSETYRLYGLETEGWTVAGSDTGGGVTFTAKKSPTTYRIVVYAGKTVTNLTFYPMLHYAEITDDTYEPYKPSVEERLAALEEKLAALEESSS